MNTIAPPIAPLIAVIDVGKTHSKIALVDPALGLEVWSTRRTNNVVNGEILRELDVVAIESWLLDSLRSAPQRERVVAIVTVAHGAAAVLVDHDGDVIIAPDYEDTCFDEVAEEYVALRDPFAVTFSPNLPQGLNLGRQLYYLQSRHGEMFRRVSHILMYPQYWSWRLSGVVATEVTALGTHTDLWRPHDDSYSALARKQGWARLMPSMHRATERLGTLRPRSPPRRDCRNCASCGLHDSNSTCDFSRIASASVHRGVERHVDHCHSQLGRPARPSETRHARQRQRVGARSRPRATWRASTGIAREAARLDALIECRPGAIALLRLRAPVPTTADAAPSKAPMGSTPRNARRWPPCIRHS
jgi:hypothetical protein